MRIQSPMPKIVAVAEAAINRTFQHNPAHSRKREIARQVFDGGEPPTEFVEAAAIEGITTVMLAELILAKPDEVMVRDNERRRLILRVRAARSPAEVDAIIKELTP